MSKTKHLNIDKDALKKYKLVAVAYSYVERDMFPTQEAYEAEFEVVERAQQVMEEIKKLGVPVKGYHADEQLIPTLMNDKPDLVINLVDTLRGREGLSTSIPASLELLNIPYTGAGVQGFTIGCDRNLTKELWLSNGIPTPNFQFIKRRGQKIKDDLHVPLIVKLNDSGGSVGIDKFAVNETLKAAEKRVDKLMETYKLPVIVEEFIDGQEITVIVFDDGKEKHVFMAEKVFHKKVAGDHAFTNVESYDDPDSHHYQIYEGEGASTIETNAKKAFSVLNHRDYGKFDIRIDGNTKAIYFIDSNPNTAFGPAKVLPISEILALYGIKFSQTLASLLTKHARKLQTTSHLKRVNQITDSHCGPAVIQMLLNNLNIPVTQEQVAEQGGAAETIATLGMRVDQLAEAVKKLAPSVTFWYKEHATLNDIITLNQKYEVPIGVEWQGLFTELDEHSGDYEDKETDYGHYSIINHVDVEKKHLLIIDPYEEFAKHDRILSFEEFEPRWWDTNEVTNPKTKKAELVKDEQMLFVITPVDQTFPAKLGLQVME